MFIAAFLVIKIWKKSRLISDEWTKKIQYIHIHNEMYVSYKD